MHSVDAMKPGAMQSSAMVDGISGSRALVVEHILASIAEPGAGPSYSVQALARALARQGATVRLRTVDGWRARGAELAECDMINHTVHRRDFASVPVLSGVCASGDLERALRASAETAAIFHAHGLWLMPNVYPAWAARGTRTCLVISPRGMLGAEALAFSRGKKAIFWRLLQERALRSAACLHATSDAEHRDIRAMGLRAPVAVIPNGVDVPPAARGAPGGQRVVLSLGRIHPKKGLDRLVHAWAHVEVLFPDWRLRIVGPPELGHDHQLKALAMSLKLTRVSIEGPVFGPAKQAAYHEADLFVLPTRNENFAMTVAEALAAGIPVISTKGAPWSGLATEECGWWIDHGIEPLVAALRESMSNSRDSLSAMGARGRAWMTRDFGWNRIAAEMMDVYRWLALGADRPATVRLD